MKMNLADQRLLVIEETLENHTRRLDVHSKILNHHAALHEETRQALEAFDAAIGRLRDDLQFEPPQPVKPMWFS